MKTKLLLLCLFTVFSAGALFGQESPTEEPATTATDVIRQVSNGNLFIRGNSRYYIGRVRVSRTEMLTLAAPYPGFADEIRRETDFKGAATTKMPVYHEK